MKRLVKLKIMEFSQGIGVIHKKVVPKEFTNVFGEKFIYIHQGVCYFINIGSKVKMPRLCEG